MGVAEFIVIGAMLVLNGVFAAYELALASVRLQRLHVLVEQRRAGARAALAMKDRMEASLAVVQVGITLVGAIAAAVGGANAEEDIAPGIQSMLGISETLADVLAITLIVVPLSAVTIVVGELIPKVFAIRNAEMVCLRLSPFMRIMAFIAFPAVWLFERITLMVLRAIEGAFGKAGHDAPQQGLQELRAQVQLLRLGKVIGEQEEQIILRASRLSTLQVRDIMLPAGDIVMLEVDAPLSRNLIAAHMDLHTRFPVTEAAGDAQRIVGYVTFKEMVLLAKTHPHNPKLREIMRPLISLDAGSSVSEALQQMTAQHVHLALVRDTTTRVVGMVTQEDVFEELVGDIQDEFDRLPRYIAKSGRQWIVGGGTQLGRLRQELGMPELGQPLPPETNLNNWLQHGTDRHLKGGDVIQLGKAAALVRKVRRHQVAEALIDVEGGRPHTALAFDAASSNDRPAEPDAAI